MNIKRYNVCIKTLEKAFNANIDAKCSNRKQGARFYTEKQRCINKAIRLIKKYALPIKHGIYGDVYYFEQSESRQVSFHIHFVWGAHDRKTHKVFHGGWIGYQNFQFPLKYL